LDFVYTCREADTMSMMATDSKGRRLRRTFTEALKAGALRLILEEGKTARSSTRSFR